MKYFEVSFTIEPCSQDAQDLLSALAGEAGFETFEETADGLTGYVQQSLFDQPALDAALEGFPFDHTRITYNVREAEDRDWNEQWEQEGFEPIVVAEQIVIHDGRHTGGTDLAHYPIAIEIDAHLAFGTGSHETTRMICATLLDIPVAGKRVLDCGCGTGILGICALKLGADSCTAYDIDEWSVDNCRHNAIINRVDERMTELHGDATLLDRTDIRTFDLVMANINRNILLQDMEQFARVMVADARLVLSGFYQQDCHQLCEHAQRLGLELQQQRHDGEWACLLFHKKL